MSEHVIGASVPNVNARRMVTGNGRFVADMYLPRAATAVFVRSEFAHAWIRGIDTSAAEDMPGVVAVLTAKDLPQVTLQSQSRSGNLRLTPQSVLATDRVRFVGEAVAVVVAEDQYLAEDAVEKVVIDYDPIPVLVDARAPDPDGFVPLAEGLTDGLVVDESATFGNVAEAFAEAAHIAHVRIGHGRTSAAPMETCGCLAYHDLAEGILTLWCSTQAPHRLRNKLAAALQMGEHRINVIMHDVGGAFGQKIPVRPEEVVTCIASRLVRRPVKWIEDRRENLLAAPQARGAIIDAELAIDSEGRILGLRAEVTGDAGAYSYNSTSALTEPLIATRAGLLGCYRIENYQYHFVARLTNKAPIAAYRGTGNVAGQTVRELLLDRAARLSGIDRAEIRRRNIVRADELPYKTATGAELDSGSHIEAFEQVLDKIEYSRFREEQSESRKNGIYLGLGLSVFVEGTGTGTEMMRQLYGKANVNHDAVRLSFDDSGKVTVAIGTTAQGQGSETAMTQVAAEVLGVPFDDVVVVLRDTNTAPISSGGTRGSRVAVVTGGAVGRAAEELREQLLFVAAHLLECSPTDLDITEGVIHVKGDPDSRATVGEVIRHGFHSLELRDLGFEPTFTVTKFYDPGPAFSNGAVACIVEVDPRTGKVNLQRVIATDDCGTMINPAIVNGQVKGGFTQGMGAALFERLFYDEDGQILTTTFMDFLTPTALEVPAIELDHITSPSPNTWRGIKGIGEGGFIGMQAAVVTAVADAVPLDTISRTPVLPEDVAAMFDSELPLAGTK